MALESYNREIAAAAQHYASETKYRSDPGVGARELAHSIEQRAHAQGTAPVVVFESRASQLV